MLSKSAGICTGAMIALATTACHRVQQRVEMMADEPTATDAALGSMADNARAHNLAIADIHFVPHSSEISGLGEKALERFAPWLETYGGTLRYETYLTNEDLVVKRIAHAREYLALVGCDVDRIHITAMMSGGRMITAADAIRIRTAGTGGDAAGGRTSAPGGPGAAGLQSGGQPFGSQKN